MNPQTQSLITNGISAGVLTSLAVIDLKSKSQEKSLNLDGVMKMLQKLQAEFSKLKNFLPKVANPPSSQSPKSLFISSCDDLLYGLIEIEDWLGKPQQPKDLSSAVAVMKELKRHADNMTKYTDLPDLDEPESRSQKSQDASKPVDVEAEKARIRAAMMADIGVLMQFSAAAVAQVATDELHQEQEANEKTKQEYQKRDQEILDNLDRQREAILQEVFSEKPAEPEPARRPAGRPTQPRLNERQPTDGGRAPAAGTLGYPGIPPCYYTLEELQAKVKPEGVDTGRLEWYLSNADFRQVVGIEKGQFYEQPGWKQSMMKKKAGLF